VGKINFSKKLEEANEEFLKNSNFYDMQMDPATSKIKYAILSDAKFMKLKVGDVLNAPKSQIEMIAARLAKFPSEEITQDVTAANVMDLPLTKLSRVPGSSISQFIEQIPGTFLTLVTDEQLKELDLSKVSKDQVEELFGYVDGNTEVQRFALLTTEQVQSILFKLEGKYIRLISDVQLPQLDLSGLSKNRIEELFRYVDDQEEYQRFALLTTKQVQSILTKLEGRYIRYISDKQLSQLDLSGLSKNRIEELFRYVDDQQEYQRFALLTTKQVQSILTKLEGRFIRYISDKQLPELDLSGLSKNRIEELFRYIDDEQEYQRFALLTTKQVQSILSKLEGRFIRYISDKQLPQLDLSGLSKSRIEELFRYVDDEREYQRFALLTTEQVQSILTKLEGRFIRYISDKQLPQLDLSRLSKSRIEELFRYVDGIEEYRRFKLLSLEQRQAIKNYLRPAFQKLATA